ncbi:MAG TPA: C4-dicarboxylate ABC transporter [Succinivibrionaceae bacterium]|nr:anaerobic C4-dicarboxylate transporter [Succinivibrio sp.]HAR79571.1 C4-dicarboxylate ABC transporter [Succinivibrionaceae bacterium]
MIVIELIVLLGAIFLGVRLGGIAIGYAGGAGVLALCCLGLKAGNIPWDVILIIASVISAISAMQKAGGLDYLVKVAVGILRAHPKQINFLAPAVTWLLTILSGTGHATFSMIPVITEVAKKENIKPSVPLSISVVSSQIGITASPVSAAVVFMAGDMALGGIGVEYPVLLMAWIPTTFLGCMLTSLVMNLFYKMDLNKDPVYLERLKNGEFSKAKTQEISLDKYPYARRSVLLFLAGVFMVVFYSCAISNNIQLIKPTVITGYEEVYENKSPIEFEKIKQEGTLEIQQSQQEGAYFKVPVKAYALSRDSAIISFMLTIAALITVFCRIDLSQVASSSTFKSGMSACICVLGVAWLGDTFVSNHNKEITDLAKNFVSEYPPLLAVALFVASTLLYSQAATAKALIPTVIAALGITSANPEQAYILVASFPAVSALFVLPTYPTLLGAVEMDDTGTTRIGKYIFNHSFFIPGVLAISFSVFLGFLLAPILV